MTHFVVVGLGSIGRRHAANLASLRPQARFTFVRRGAVGDDFTRSLDAHVVGGLDEITEQPDLVVVATPSGSHIDVLPRLIELGYPLLVEKPIVSELTDCDVVDRALDAAPEALRVAGFNLRYLPSLIALKRAVENGEAGSLARASLIAGQWLPDWRPGSDYRSGYSARGELGGGVELDLSHEFDMARWLFGELRVDHAQSARLSDLEIDTSDTSVAVLTPRDRPGPVTVVAVDYVSRRAVRKYDVVGDRASIHWNLDGVLESVDAHGSRMLTDERSAFDVPATYIELMRTVIEAMEGHHTGALQSLRDGVMSSRLAISARDLGREP